MFTRILKSLNLLILIWNHIENNLRNLIQSKSKKDQLHN